jgi:L-2-hydroxyglutarate oxidase LhgO
LPFRFSAYLKADPTPAHWLVGGGATADGMGHIVVVDDSEPQFALTRYSHRLWQALRPESPSDLEYDQYGTIWVAVDEEEMAEVQRKHDYYACLGVPTTGFDVQALKRLEPNLRDGLAGGLLVSERCGIVSARRDALLREYPS